MVVSLLPAQDAAVAAGTALDRDGAKAWYGGCELRPDEAAEVFQSGDAEIGHLVEQVVIEFLAHPCDLCAQQRQVDHHAGRVGRAAHGHLGLVGVAMHTAAALSLHRTAQCV